MRSLDDRKRAAQEEDDGLLMIGRSIDRRRRKKVSMPICKELAKQDRRRNQKDRAGGGTPVQIGTHSTPITTHRGSITFSGPRLIGYRLSTASLSSNLARTHASVNQACPPKGHWHNPRQGYTTRMTRRTENKEHRSQERVAAGCSYLSHRYSTAAARTVGFVVVWILAGSAWFESTHKD